MHKLSLMIGLLWIVVLNPSPVASQESLTTNENPLLDFVTDDTVALVLANPRSLINDTEQVVLGDIAYLGQFPNPPSEIENLAVYVALGLDGEPTIVLGFHFRGAVAPFTLRRWLAANAVEISKSRASPVNSTPAELSTNNPWDNAAFAIPSERMALFSLDSTALAMMLRQAEVTVAQGELANQSRKLKPPVNFAAMVDVGQIRRLAESMPDLESFGVTKEIISLPIELSVISLEASYGRQTNELEIRLVASDGMKELPELRAWGNKMDVEVSRLLTTLVDDANLNLPDEIARDIDGLVDKVEQFLGQFKEADSREDILLQMPNAPSLSRTMQQGVSILSVFVSMARDSARRIQNTNNLKQVMLAWMNYASANQNSLPQDILSSDGTPLLSWRVRILPLLGDESLVLLYQEFRLDEPWDSAHNERLLKRMPALYSDVWNREAQTHTRVQGVVADGTVLNKGVKLSDVKDGTSNTAALLPSATPVPWTKPADIAGGEDIVSKIHFHRESVPMAFLDGSVSNFPKLTQDVYQKLFCINDGETISEQELESVSAEETLVEDRERVKISDVPSLLNNLQSEDVKLVRKAARKLLLGKTDLDDALRHPMSRVLLAWHNYYDMYGNFPTNIANDGRAPMLSWRVAILPFVGEQELFDQFHLDEPWDSEHNRELIEKIPSAFGRTGNSMPKGSTRLLAVTGKGTVFEDRATLDRINDGTSYTAVLVEANTPVIWTKPDDLAIQEAFFEQLYSTEANRNVVGMLDGLIVGINKLSDADYRSLFLHSDGRLLKLPKGSEPKVSDSLVSKIVDTASKLFSSKNREIRLWAVRVFWQYLPFDTALDKPQIKLMLDDSCREIRRQTIFNLAFRNSPDAATMLFELSGSDELIVDKILVDPLRDVAADALVQVLVELNPNQRSRAVKIIGLTGDETHLPALGEFAADPLVGDITKIAIAEIEKRFKSEVDDQTDFENQLEKQRMENVAFQLRQSAQQLMEDNKADEALEAVGQLLELERQIYGDDHEEVLATIRWMINTYESLGRLDDAAMMLQLMTKLVTQKYGEEHSEARNAVANYNALTSKLGLTEKQRVRFDDSEVKAKQAFQQHQQKQYDSAIEALQEVVNTRRELFGDNSVLLLPMLRFQRQCLFDAKRYEEARLAAVEVVRIVTLILGATDPTTQTDRSELAYLTFFAGDADAAIAQLIELQDDSADESTREMMARDARFIGQHLLRKGQLSEASHQFQKSLKWQDEGGQFQQGGELCALLASSALTTDRDSRYRWRSESIWRYQQENPYLGMWTNYPALADSMHESGKYHLELVLRKSLVDAMQRGVNEKVVGMLFYAKALTALAETYVTLGDFVLADETLEECSRIIGDFRDDPFVIAWLTNRAKLHRHYGESAKAEQLLVEATVVSQKEGEGFRKQSPKTFRRLAESYAEAGQYDRAMKLLERARENQKDQQSIENVRLHVAIARVHSQLQDRKRAMETAAVATQVLESLQVSAGPKVELLSDCGQLWLALGDLGQAEKLIQSALKLSAESYGTDTLPYSQLLGALSQIQVAQQKPAAAVATSLNALTTARAIVEQSAYLLSPRQQIAFGETMRSSLDTYLSIAIQDPESARDCFNQIYLWKGSGMVRQRALRKLIEEAGVAPFYEQLGKLTPHLSNIVRKSDKETDDSQFTIATVQDESTIDSLEENVKSLSRVKDLLEAQMSASRLAYMDLDTTTTVDEFIAALPPESLFIDYFVFERKLEGESERTVREIFATSVSGEGKITVRLLGDMSKIEKAIGVWRKTLGVSPESKQAGEFLRSCLWDPFESQLRLANTILISPDDALGRLPFHALPTKDAKRYLIEDHRIAVVAVPQLVPTLVNRESTKHAKRLLLVGDVEYGLESTLPKEEEKSYSPSDKRVTSAMKRSFRGETKFTALPATREEIQTIQKLHEKFAATNSSNNALSILSGTKASETSFRETASNFGGIHIATHGFFAPPPLGENEVDRRAKLKMQSFNPGLLSGLAFAGANKTNVGDSDDGVLTSDEIATLDLQGVELAVLSACETGLGRVAGGEGLIGIQRSFQLSGAGATVASLWRVPDKETRILMERFYRNCWEKKMSSLDALRDAQIAMIRNYSQTDGVLRGLEPEATNAKKSESEHLPPLYWAAWILSGDWR